MKVLRYIFDLPWWTGLPIFLGGNFLFHENYELWGYLMGMGMCLFGGWTFSKLLKYDEFTMSNPAVVGLPLVLLSGWYLKNPYVSDICYLINYPQLEFTELYILRSAIMFFLTLYSIKGFAK